MILSSKQSPLQLRASLEKDETNSLELNTDDIFSLTLSAGNRGGHGGWGGYTASPGHGRRVGIHTPEEQNLEKNGRRKPLNLLFA